MTTASKRGKSSARPVAPGSDVEIALDPAFFSQESPDWLAPAEVMRKVGRVNMRRHAPLKPLINVALGSGLSEARTSLAKMVQQVSFSMETVAGEEVRDRPDLATAAARVGAPAGDPIDADSVDAVLNRIAEDATDLFENAATARQYLEQERFGPGGSSARDLVRAGRATSVLARLEELRFGVSG